MKQTLIGIAVCITGIALVFGISVMKKNPCANSISCVRSLTGDFENGTESTYMGHPVVLPQSLADLSIPSAVLGAQASEKHIYVDLSTQQLTAYEGKKMVMTFPVATGKWNRTPTGDFRIWVKLLYTRMQGGNIDDGTYYNLANVPYTMFFYNDAVPKSQGFALHGAYWHNNYGHPMSHGCVNIRPVDAERLFVWADPVSAGKITYASQENPGTVVTITGQTPDE